MSDVVGVPSQGEQLLAASMAAMAVLEDGRHVSVNRQYADLFGFEERDDLEGTAWRDRFDEGARTRLEDDIVPLCRETGRWRGEITGRRRDGSDLPLELSLARLDAGRYAACLRELDPGAGTTSHAEAGLGTGRRGAPGPVESAPGSDRLVRDGALRGARRRPHGRGDERRPTSEPVDELVLRITRDLFGAASRRELEEAVCADLAASDRYRFAWIGMPAPGGDRLVATAAAGIDACDVEATLAARGAGDEPGPAGRTFRSGEATVSRDVPVDPAFDGWRSAAADRDVGSAAVVPLASGETIHGVLAVAATRPGAFGRRERESLETLGRAVAFAREAVETRELLYADAVVELEFEVSDGDPVLVGASDRHDCELTVTGCVGSADGTWSVYVSVADAPPSAVRDAALDAPDVEDVRVIAEADDGGSLELVMAGPALDHLAASGAVLTSGRAARGQGRFCLEVPRSADVHRLADRLRAAYPDATLVAQREYERPVRTATEVRQSLDDRLTDRQREALERATHAGYFEWPRTSTAGEVAESMDVSETTFHYHLRNGLDTLVGTLTDLDGR